MNGTGKQAPKTAPSSAVKDSDALPTPSASKKRARPASSGNNGNDDDIDIDSIKIAKPPRKLSAREMIDRVNRDMEDPELIEESRTTYSQYVSSRLHAQATAKAGRVGGRGPTAAALEQAKAKRNLVFKAIYDTLEEMFGNASPQLIDGLGQFLGMLLAGGIHIPASAVSIYSETVGEEERTKWFRAITKITYACAQPDLVEHPTMDREAYSKYHCERMLEAINSGKLGSGARSEAAPAPPPKKTRPVINLAALGDDL